MRDVHDRGGNPSKGTEEESVTCFLGTVKSPQNGTQATGRSWFLCPIGLALLDHWTANSAWGQMPNHHCHIPTIYIGTNMEQHVKDNCLMKEGISPHLNT